ncbi:MAG: hypothetical protein H6Q17_382 [Bacteroidetes bacterium]|nr:hypothetical protein [Bacteroidota bacterium]
MFDSILLKFEIWRVCKEKHAKVAKCNELTKKPQCSCIIFCQ